MGVTLHITGYFSKPKRVLQLFVWLATWVLCASNSYSQKNISFLVYSGDIETPFNQLNEQLFKSADNVQLSYFDEGCLIKIQPPTGEKFQEVPHYLLVHHQAVNEVEYFLLEGDSLITHQRTGLYFPVSSREFSLNHFVFQLPEEGEGKVIYVKFKNHGASLKTRLSILSAGELYKKLLWENYLFFFLLGGLFLQALYVLGQYFLYRIRWFVFYVFYVVFTLLHQAFNLGWGVFILPDSMLYMMNDFRFFWTIPGYLSMLGFGYGLLDVNELAGKKVARFLKITAWVMTVFMGLVFLPIGIEAKRIGALIFYLISPFGFLVLLYAAYKAAIQKHPPGLYFLIGQIPVVAVLLIFILRNFKLIPYNGMSENIIFGVLIWETSVTLFCLISYVKRINVLKIPEIETGQADEASVLENGKTETGILIEKPGGADEQVLKLFGAIVHYFETEKPYLNSKLRMETVASSLHQSPHAISNAVNSCSEMHFFDFVNSFRIAHAKKLLSDDEIITQYSQEAIASLCGFSNKSSFYNAFKKFTGTTPLQYRKNGS